MQDELGLAARGGHLLERLPHSRTLPLEGAVVEQIGTDPVVLLHFESGAKLRIDGYFFLKTDTQSCAGNGDEFTDVSAFAPLVGRRVEQASVSQHGGLLLRFGGGAQLIVIQDMRHGPWVVWAADGACIASSPGGSLAVWPSQAPTVWPPGSPEMEWRVEVYQPADPDHDFTLLLGRATPLEMKYLVGWGGDADLLASGVAVTVPALERLGARFNVRFHRGKLAYVLVGSRPEGNETQ
jgi:hypothetical protein